MRVNVTKEHIHRGVVEDPCQCPVALALNCGACVGYGDVVIGNETYILPPEAIAFVKAFDNCVHVDPITFNMERRCK